MSLAILNDYRSSSATTTPVLTSVDTAATARGFALYVGLDEATALAAGVDLSTVVTALKATLASLVPAAETYAAVALAPAAATGRNIDLVRTALRDPRALDKLVAASNPDSAPAKGLVVDFTRHRVYVDGVNAEFTNREFDLLSFLIDYEGVTVSRADLVNAVWGSELDGVNERTVDVHVRRLRAKIAGYEDVIRTIRGGGYRFDKHPDVLIEA